MFHNQSTMSGHAHRLQALEGQFAQRLTAHLHDGAQALPHDVTERLRFSRERALASHQAATTLVTAPVFLHAGRAAALGSPPSLWLRMASALPLAMLVAGLVFIQHHHDLQQIEVAAEIDSALLADDLPPAAYGDPGFLEFLRNGEAP